MIRRAMPLVILAALLIGCGAGNRTPADAQPVDVNRPDVLAQWSEAQRTLANPPDARGIPMNPETRPDGAALWFIPAQPGALQVELQNVAVYGVPDDSQHSIKCPAATTPARVYSCVVFGSPDRVFAAQSLIPQALEWEFENVILKRLGQDPSAR